MFFMNNTLIMPTVGLDKAISLPSHSLYHFKGTISRKRL
jgi:hypothetical protein